MDKTCNEYTTDNKRMADILQDQYQSVFSIPTQTTFDPDYMEIVPNANLSDVEFNKNDFIEAIKSIDSNSAAGPDGFPAILLKKCSENISEPLCKLWRECLDKGITPLKMKTSHIAPIFKGGNQGEAQNYRPVSLTSHLIKVYEKVIRKKIVDFLEDNNLFNRSQHGLRKGRSCLSQLLEHYDTILTYLEKGMNVDQYI